MTGWKRWWPAVLVAALMAAVYFSGGAEYLSFEALKSHRLFILEFAQKHPVLFPLCYIAVYILVTAISLPAAGFLTFAGGFFFPQPLSTLYVLIGATAGATITFLIIKTSFGELFKRKACKKFRRIDRGLRNNKVNYLLFLRLFPLFPYWIVNIVLGFFRISLKTFIWTTFVGMTPGTFVTTQAGRGLGAILDSGQEFSLQAVLNWHVKIALMALGLFSLVPILAKRLKKK